MCLTLYPSTQDLWGNIFGTPACKDLLSYLLPNPNLNRKTVYLMTPPCANYILPRPDQNNLSSKATFNAYNHFETARIT